jgi:hypothetical protein
LASPTLANSYPYTVGRFLGLASIARDPKLWQVPPEQIVARLIEIADEHEAARDEPVPEFPPSVTSDTQHVDRALEAFNQGRDSNNHAPARPLRFDELSREDREQVLAEAQNNKHRGSAA